MVVGVASVTIDDECGGLDMPAFATKVGGYIGWVKTKANIKSGNRMVACGVPMG